VARSALHLKDGLSLSGVTSWHRHLKLKNISKMSCGENKKKGQTRKKKKNGQKEESDNKKGRTKCE
jgi:hypothetical protein